MIDGLAILMLVSLVMSAFLLLITIGSYLDNRDLRKRLSNLSTVRDMVYGSAEAITNGLDSRDARIIQLEADRDANLRIKRELNQDIARQDAEINRLNARLSHFVELAQQPIENECHINWVKP